MLKSADCPHRQACQRGKGAHAQRRRATGVSRSQGGLSQSPGRSGIIDAFSTTDMVEVRPSSCERASTKCYKKSVVSADPTHIQAQRSPYCSELGK